MKKVIILFIFIIICFASFADSGYIRGKVLKHNRNSHYNIDVVLIDAKGAVVSKKQTQSAGIFYFRDIPDGRYILKASSGNLKESVSFEKKAKNIKLSKVYLYPDKRSSAENGVAQLFYLIVFIINLLFIFVVKKSGKFSSKKYFYILIALFNFQLGMEIVRFIIGFLNEETASLLKPFGFIAPVMASYVVFKIIKEMPVKRNNLILKVIDTGVFLVLVLTYLMVVLFFEFYEFMPQLVNTDTLNYLYEAALFSWDFVPIMMIVVSAILLILNIKGHKEGIVVGSSKYLLWTGAGVIAFLIPGSVMMDRVFRLPFENYEQLFFSTIAVVTVFNLSVALLNLRMMESYKKIRFAIFESAKIFVSLITGFSSYKVLGEENFIYIIVIVLAVKSLLDFAERKTMESSYLDIDLILKKIDSAFDYKEIDGILSSDFRERIGAEKIKFITAGDVEFPKYLVVDDETKIVRNKNINEEKLYDFAVKVNAGGKCSGLILIGAKADAGLYKRGEIEAMLELAERIGVSLNNIAAQKTGKSIMIEEIESYEALRIKRICEHSEYIKGYSERLGDVVKAGNSEEIIAAIIKSSETIKEEVQKWKK